MKKVYIYALYDPDTHLVRYIGKTSRPERRLQEHIRNKDREDTRKTRWINKLLFGGKLPEIKILEVVCETAWEAAEQKWIAFFRAKGLDLVNLTDGGDGLHNPSEETRKKLSATQKAKYSDPDYRKRFEGVMKNPERCRKISEALKGKSKSPEHIAKLSQNKPGRKLSLEQRLKITISLQGNQRALGHYHTEETKQKISASLKGNTHTLGRKMPDAEKAIRSAALKDRPKSEEHKGKIRQGLVASWEKRRTGDECDWEAFSKQMSQRNRGENSGTAKLSEQSVREIRQRYAAGGTTMQRLSKEFGVTTSRISDIVHYKTWKHLLE